MTTIGAGIADAFGGLPVHHVPPAPSAPAAEATQAPSAEFPPDPVRQALDVPREDTRRKIATTSHALANAAQVLGLDRDALRAAVSEVVGREIAGARDLTPEECDLALYAMRGRLAQRRALLEDHEGRRRMIAAIEEAARAARADSLEAAREKFQRTDLRYLADLTNDERKELLWHLREVAKKGGTK